MTRLTMTRSRNKCQPFPYDSNMGGLYDESESSLESIIVFLHADRDLVADPGIPVV